MMNCKINRTKYEMLPAEIQPSIIETEEENERVLAAVEQLMKKGEGNSSPEETSLLSPARTFERRF